MEEKKCSKCGRILHISNFTPHKMSKDGYSHLCKECLHESKAKAKKGDNQATSSDSSSNPLARFTPRQLMEELRRRDYDGEITFVQRIKLSQI